MLMKPNQYDGPSVAIPLPNSVQPKQPNFLTRVVQKIESYTEHKRQSRDLLSLDDHMLKDIGLGRAEAEHLARRPFKWT